MEENNLLKSENITSTNEGVKQSLDLATEVGKLINNDAGSYSLQPVEVEANAKSVMMRKLKLRKRRKVRRVRKERNMKKGKTISRSGASKVRRKRISRRLQKYRKRMREECQETRKKLRTSANLLAKKGTYSKRSLMRLIKQKGPQYFHQFSEMTTLHGMRYLGEKNRCLLERVFWGLAMVVAYSNCWYFAAQVNFKWRATPVVMSVETQPTASWSIPSPAITVCTTSHISHTKFDVANICSMKNLSSSMDEQLNVVLELCGMVEGEEEYLDDEAVKYVLNNYLPDMEGVFISISRMQETIAPLSEVIQTLITPVSICFVHNMLPLKSLFRAEFLHVYEYYGLIGNQSSGQQLHSSWTPELGYQTDEPQVTPMRLWGNEFRGSTKYLLGVNDLDYDPTCSFGAKGLSVYLHNPAEIPWRVHSNIFLETNFRVAAFITPVVTSTDDEVKVWNPAKRGCYFENERYLRFYQIYTQRNCEKECDSNNTLKSCGCVLLSHPRNMKMRICGPKKHACVEKSQRDMIEQEMKKQSNAHCNCYPSCNEIDFTAETHWRPWQFNINSTYATVPGSINLNSSAISLLAVAVKKKYLNITKRTALMGSAAFVASIGGILSLFLGISFLSLFEVVYFMTLRVLTNIWNLRKRERQVHQGQCWASHNEFNLKKRPFLP